MENKKINSIKNTIVNLFDEVMTMKGTYSRPYSTQYVDWSVMFKIDRVNIWVPERYYKCQYSGTIYLKSIEIKVGPEGDSEYMDYISDLPSWVEDDIKDSIIDVVEQYFPNICVDVDFS